MKGHTVTIMLMAMALTAGAFCQEPPEQWRPSQEGIEHDMQLRQRELEARERDLELEYQRRMQELEAERLRLGMEREHHREGGSSFLAICLIVHVLLAIWVYQDIRKRSAGSGLWVVITLLTGFFGALLYAIVRLGDIRQTPER